MYDGMGGFLGGRLPAVGRQLRAGEPAPPPPMMPDFAALPASLLTNCRNGGGLSAAEALVVGRQLNVDTGFLARHHQGLSRIYLRGIYPGIISIIIRNMGLGDIFGSEYAFLSERIIILQTAQAADYIVFSSDSLHSSISDRHEVSHVCRRF